MSKNKNRLLVTSAFFCALIINQTYANSQEFFADINSEENRTATPTSIIDPLFHTNTPLSMRLNSTNPAVKTLQRFLVNQGFLLSTNVNGQYLTTTANAVKKFQTKNGLIADGVFAQATIDKANAIACTLPASQLSIIDPLFHTATTTAIINPVLAPTNINSDAFATRALPTEPIPQELHDKVAERIQEKEESALLVHAIQELNTKNLAQQKQIDIQQKEIASLKSTLVTVLERLDKYDKLEAILNNIDVDTLASLYDALDEEEA